MTRALQLTVFVISFLLISGIFQVNAQPCTPPQPSGNVGFAPAWTQLDTIYHGQSYSQVITFEHDTMVAGGKVVDSFRIDSIGVVGSSSGVPQPHGLPSGISYITNKGTPQATYTPGSSGCIVFNGTTTAPSGKYHFGIWVTLWAPPIANGMSEEWNQLASQLQISGANPNHSYLVVRDSGCSPLSINANVQDVTHCDSTNGSITASASGGTSPYSYDWSNGQSGSTITGLPSGTYTVTVTDSNNCLGTKTEEVSIVGGNSCVWPGDVNNDGIASNFDLLLVGLTHGATGPPRANISTLWEPKTATPWNQTFFNGLDYKFADCNGDGTINDQDSMAIYQNYNKTHNKASGSNNPQAPPVSLEMQQDSVFAGETIQVPVSVGSSNQPVSDLYGLAFSVNYTNEVIEDNSVSFERSNNSWLSSQGQLLSINKELPSMGKLDIGITGTDQQNRSGSGTIGYVEMTVADDFNASSGTMLQLSVTDIQAIDAQEASVPLQGTSDSAQAFDNSTSIGGQPGLSSVRIYPNPAREIVTIDGIQKLDVDRIRILNVLGEVEETVIPAKQRSKVTLQTQEWAEGIYFVTISSEDGATINKKLVVNK